MCIEGTFIKAKNDQNNNYDSNGHIFNPSDPIKILHFGSPNYIGERIIINPQVLNSKYENKVRLKLSFGGKKSPMKFSNYTLDFNKLDLNKKNEPNYLIHEIEENVLSSEKQKEKNNSKVETLRQILKR